MSQRESKSVTTFWIEVRYDTFNKSPQSVPKPSWSCSVQFPYLFRLWCCFLLCYCFSDYWYIDVGFYTKLNPWSTFFLGKKFPDFSETRKCITVFTRFRHWFLFWATWIQFTSLHPISLRSILIISSHLFLVLPSDLFRFSDGSFAFISHFFYGSYTLRSSHPPWFDHPILVV